MPAWRASSLFVSWSVLYLILCRILQFVILLGRGDRAKEVEILVLRHQVAVL
jgi:putative transposase